MDAKTIASSAFKVAFSMHGAFRLRQRASHSAAYRRRARLRTRATLDFPRVPPGKRLEALKGDRAGQHSIRFNNQFRVCFRWQDGDALDVKTVGYH